MDVLLAGIIAFTAFMASSSALAGSTLCPETIKVQQTGSAPVAGWSVSYSKSPIQLETASFYRGPPKDGASLGYDSLVNAMDGSTVTWKLPKDSRAYWVKCSYHGTTLELSKELPRTLSSCLVSYDHQRDEGSAQPYVKALACN